MLTIDSYVRWKEEMYSVGIGYYDLVLETLYGWPGSVAYFTNKADGTDLKCYFPLFYVLGNEEDSRSQSYLFYIPFLRGIVSVFFNGIFNFCQTISYNIYMQKSVRKLVVIIMD